MENRELRSENTCLCFSEVCKVTSLLATTTLQVVLYLEARKTFWLGLETQTCLEAGKSVPTFTPYDLWGCLLSSFRLVYQHWHQKVASKLLWDYAKLLQVSKWCLFFKPKSVSFSNNAVLTWNISLWSLFSSFHCCFVFFLFVCFLFAELFLYPLLAVAIDLLPIINHKWLVNYVISWLPAAVLSVAK